MGPGTKPTQAELDELNRAAWEAGDRTAIDPDALRWDRMVVGFDNGLRAALSPIAKAWKAAGQGEHGIKVESFQGFLGDLGTAVKHFQAGGAMGLGFFARLGTAAVRAPWRWGQTAPADPNAWWLPRTWSRVMALSDNPFSRTMDGAAETLAPPGHDADKPKVVQWANWAATFLGALTVGPGGTVKTAASVAGLPKAFAVVGRVGSRTETVVRGGSGAQAGERVFWQTGKVGGDNVTREGIAQARSPLNPTGAPLMLETRIQTVGGAIAQVAKGALATAATRPIRTAVVAGAADEVLFDGAGRGWLGRQILSRYATPFLFAGLGAAAALSMNFQGVTAWNFIPKVLFAVPAALMGVAAGLAAYAATKNLVPDFDKFEAGVDGQAKKFLAWMDERKEKQTLAQEQAPPKTGGAPEGPPLSANLQGPAVGPAQEVASPAAQGTELVQTFGPEATGASEQGLNHHRRGRGAGDPAARTRRYPGYEGKDGAEVPAYDVA